MSLRLDQINARIQQLKSGHLDQQGKSELATLYTQRQKEMLNQQIQQQLVAKNNATPEPKTREDILKEKATQSLSKLPKPVESEPIKGLAVEKTIKTDTTES